MTERPLNILQVNTLDVAGGAEKIAWSMFQAYRRRGHGSWLAVGYKRSQEPDVLLIPNYQAKLGWSNFWWRVCARLQSLSGPVRGAGRLNSFARGLATPRNLLDGYRGIENFHFPGTWRLLELTPHRPDIIHCHNLHGEYFDLRALPWLSQQLPLVLTLHDAWLLSGHCAHSFGCQRWQTGCGSCPDLTIYPAIQRDATAYNWQRKRDLYAHSRLYVATPSKWLMRKVEQSILAPVVIEAQVISNGVDLSIFQPADKQKVRARLGLPQDTRVILFTANSIRGNVWKDYQTMRAAIALVAKHLPNQKMTFIALGEKGPAEQIGPAEVRFVPFQKDPKAVAHYYQAADIYLHAAHAEVWGLTITEALACGTPVVATAVGGIPEQVKGLQVEGSNWQVEGQELNSHGLDQATGILTPPGDAQGMAKAIMALLNHENELKRLGQNAATDARQRFDLKYQVETYLEWYQQIINRSITA